MRACSASRKGQRQMARERARTRERAHKTGTFVCVPPQSLLALLGRCSPNQGIVLEFLTFFPTRPQVERTPTCDSSTVARGNKKWFLSNVSKMILVQRFNYFIFGDFLYRIKFWFFLQIMFFVVFLFLFRTPVSMISIEIMERGVYSNYQRGVHSNCQRGVYSNLSLSAYLWSTPVGARSPPPPRAPDKWAYTVSIGQVSVHCFKRAQERIFQIEITVTWNCAQMCEREIVEEREKASETVTGRKITCMHACVCVCVRVCARVDPFSRETEKRMRESPSPSGHVCICMCVCVCERERVCVCVCVCVCVWVCVCAAVVLAGAPWALQSL